MALKNQVQLIAYPDRLGRNLSELAVFLECRLGDVIGGVHLLPPFPSNADGGFSPITHHKIDPAYGHWEDIERIAGHFDLCLDLILNHLSDESPEFKDYLRRGNASPHACLFIDVDALGPISPDDLSKIHIRKEKEPFRTVRLDDGSERRVWCTFTEKQIDLNYDAPETYALMEENLRVLTGHGVKLFRLDAFGYTTKEVGTSCFLVEPKVWRVLQWFHDKAGEFGAAVLPEVHDHSSWQYAIADRGMWAYAFALPPLVLHALMEGNSRHLKNWLRMCPHQQVTVLDTHDGICIPDVQDILPGPAVEAVIQDVSKRGADPILLRSAASVHSVGAIYQLTCTFYDALQQNDDAYIAARAIQLFTPGIPQVYYVGLLAGRNDVELMEQTGEPRNINRHHYALAEAEDMLKQPVVQRLLSLMRLRNSHSAFQGTFELCYSNDASLAMGWRNGEQRCQVFVDLHFRTTTVTLTDPDNGAESSFRA